MNQPFIKLENITKKFPGVVALDDVSLDLFEGEIHGLIGENGAGKSTLLKIIAGLMRSTSGIIKLDGVEITKDPNKNRKKEQ